MDGPASCLCKTIAKQARASICLVTLGVCLLVSGAHQRMIEPDTGSVVPTCFPKNRAVRPLKLEEPHVRCWHHMRAKQKLQMTRNGSQRQAAKTVRVIFLEREAVNLKVGSSSLPGSAFAHAPHRTEPKTKIKYTHSQVNLIVCLLVVIIRSLF